MANDLLKGKKGIIFGALNDQSIAWKVAEKAHEQGASFVLTNAPIAMRMGDINNLAEKTWSKVIPADATSMEDLEKLVTESMEILGGKIDFVLHSIGMSVNVRKGKHYTEENYDWTMKGFDVSALSFHKVLQTCKKHDAINDWGSVLALTYIAAQRVYPDYNDMAENKSYLESIARSFGYHYARQILGVHHAYARQSRFLDVPCTGQRRKYPIDRSSSNERQLLHVQQNSIFR